MKIPVIGQSLPYKAQTVPYDTTLFYKMLSWVGITKEHAQDIFVFEALLNELPGRTKNNGHKAPTKKLTIDRVKEVIIPLIDSSEKAILLGRPVHSMILNRKTGDSLIALTGKYLLLPHPSTRNYSFIMSHKEEITTQITKFFKTLTNV